MATEHDVIVVGLGVGGELVAGELAESGMDVLGVERKLVGGECPYWGCIPSKIAVRAGNSLAEAKRVNELAGRTKSEPDYSPVAAHIAEATADWDDEVAVKRLVDKGMTFLRGGAKIVSPTAIEVDGERHSARRGLVIAAGGEPAVPPIEGLSDVDYWTNRDALEAKSLPESLVVLGGGPIGLELAQSYARLGTEISVVEMGDHALPTEEPENSKAMDDVLADEGIELRAGVSADRVSASSSGVSATLSDGSSVDGARLLVAVGRRYDLTGIGVAEAGIDPDAGSIEVDEHLRAAEGVWAVGDVTGKGAFTHMATYQGRIAVADILERDHAGADYRAVPRVTFTDPEVASVGLTHAQAQGRGLDVEVGVSETASSARGWIHGPGAEHGVTKLVADAREGVLIGASTMGPAAGEVVGLLILAIKERIPVASLRQLIYPYPTFVRGLEDALAQLS